MDLVQYLQELCLSDVVDLSAYPWPSEADRWAELVFCLLNRVHPDDIELTRSAVLTLLALDLLEIPRLAAAKQVTDQYGVVLEYVLKQQGFEAEEALRSRKLLTHVAQVFEDKYQGKPQRFLRRQGEAMRDELVSMLLYETEVLSSMELRYAVTNWLQNALSMPILLGDDAVLEFCDQNGVRQEELVEAVDELQLNLALVDDLLQVEKAMAAAISETEMEDDV